MYLVYKRPRGKQKWPVRDRIDFFKLVSLLVLSQIMPTSSVEVRTYRAKRKVSKLVSVHLH